MGLARIEAAVKFISFEPLLGKTQLRSEDLTDCGINWVIIGSQTKPFKPPTKIWVREITDAAVNAGVAVFHKNNLGNIFDANGFPKRQEMPTV